MEQCHRLSRVRALWCRRSRTACRCSSTSSGGGVGFVRVSEATSTFGVSTTLLTVCIVVASATGLAVIEGNLLGEAARLLTACLSSFASFGSFAPTRRSTTFATSIAFAFAAAPLLSGVSAYGLGLEGLARVVYSSRAACNRSVLARALDLEEWTSMCCTGGCGTTR